MNLKNYTLGLFFLVGTWFNTAGCAAGVNPSLAEVDNKQVANSVDTLPSGIAISNDKSAIRFFIHGKDGLLLKQNNSGHLIFNLPNNGSNTFFGTDAGSQFVPPTKSSQHNKNIVNTLIGYSAGKNILNGKQNTFLGANTGKELKVSFGSTLVGASAGVKLNNGDWNTFVGAETGSNLTEGESNVLLGYGAGGKIKHTNNSIFIGHLAGNSGGEGGNNIFIGKDAGKNSTNTSNNIFIGTGAGENEKESNILIIDNKQNEVPLIYGKFDKGLLQINGQQGLHVIHGENAETDGFIIQKQGQDSLSWRMHVDSKKGDLHLFSDKAKQTTTPSVAVIDAETGAYLTLINSNAKNAKVSKANELKNILKLNPIAYSNSEKGAKTNLGFTGKNIQEVYPDLVKYDEAKDSYYLNYAGLNVYAITAMQKQQEELQALQGQVEELKQINEELVKQLNIMIELTKDNKK